MKLNTKKNKPLNTLSSCTCSTYLEIYQSLLFLLASFLFLFLSLLASAVLIFCQSQKWRRSLIVLWWFTNHYCVNMQWPRPNNAWQLFLHAESSVFVKNIRKRTNRCHYVDTASMKIKAKSTRLSLTNSNLFFRKSQHQLLKAFSCNKKCKKEIVWATYATHKRRYIYIKNEI